MKAEVRSAKCEVRSAVRDGFTLIELITVVTVIAVLAALIVPIAGTLNKTKVLKRARVELMQLETAIETYKARLGHYPPDNPGLWGTNQLYYELLGTKLISGNTVYSTLDDSAQIPVGGVTTTFGPGVGGFVNCSRGGGGDEGQRAQTFLKSLKAPQFLAVRNDWSVLGSTILDGPATIPGSAPGTKINPVCYNSSVYKRPDNGSPLMKNQNSFDLWIDVKVGATVYRISNWSDRPIVNPLPYYP